jgi:hypothetical protein
VSAPFPRCTPGRPAAWLALALLALELGAGCAPGGEVRDLDGRAVDALALAPGELAALVFVDPGCPLSNRLAPELARLAAEIGARPVRFSLVYCDAELDAAAVRAHLAAFDHSVEALLDPEHALAQRLGATVTPEALLLDSAGKVLYRGLIDDRAAVVGAERPAATRRYLGDAIEAALAGRTPAPERTEAVGCFLADLPGGGG